MIEMKVSVLEGAALDWAVAKAEDLPIRQGPVGFSSGPEADFWVWEESANGIKAMIGQSYSPSTIWEQLGKLICNNQIILGNHASGEGDGTFWGSAHCFLSHTRFDTWAGTMVAACRAIVAYKLGPVVAVPVSLIPD